MGNRNNLPDRQTVIWYNTKITASFALVNSQMAIFPHKYLVWTEPTDIRIVKRRISMARDGLPSLPRLLFYALGLPVLIVLGVSVGCKEICPEIDVHSVLFGPAILPCLLGCAAFVLMLPFAAVFPTRVHVMKDCLFFQVGNSGTRIGFDQIVSLSIVVDESYRLLRVEYWSRNRQRILTKSALLRENIDDEILRRALADAGYQGGLRNELVA